MAMNLRRKGLKLIGLFQKYRYMDLEQALTVSQFNNIIQEKIEDGQAYLLIAEISSITFHSSGIWYLTLKDEDSSLKAMMFGSQNYYVKFRPKAGDKVLVLGLSSFYTKLGDYKFKILSMQLYGIGTVLERIERSKALWRDTYFKRPKRAIDETVSCILVITSVQGSVIRDIIRTRNIRDRRADIYVFPSLMQGEDCADNVSEMIRCANDMFFLNPSCFGGHTQDDTLIILARGGGQFEDILPFSDEKIVKAVSESRLRIISAIGHEDDNPLCDFAADIRASTPTQAVEIALRSRTEKIEAFKALHSKFLIAFQSFVEKKILQTTDMIIEFRALREEILEEKFKKLKDLITSFVNLRERFIALQNQKLKLMESQLSSSLLLKTQIERNKLLNLSSSLTLAMNDYAKQKRHDFVSIRDNLIMLSPKAVMKRGYMVLSTEDNKNVKSKKDLKNGNYNMKFYDGNISVEIKKR